MTRGRHGVERDSRARLTYLCAAGAMGVLAIPAGLLGVYAAGVVGALVFVGLAWLVGPDRPPQPEACARVSPPWVPCEPGADGRRGEPDPGRDLSRDARMVQRRARAHYDDLGET